MREVIKRGKDLTGGVYGYPVYKVTFKKGFYAQMYIKNCNMSCGIRELENVGNFIRSLKDNDATNEEVVTELRKARQSIKAGTAAHVIASLVVDDDNREILNLLEKQKEVKIMREKTNPNSRNKINVIVM